MGERLSFLAQVFVASALRTRCSLISRPFSAQDAQSSESCNIDIGSYKHQETMQPCRRNYTVELEHHVLHC